MAFNGSGVFNRLYSFVADAAANIKIRADRMDNEMNGFATGLSTCITKDGQTNPTANLKMSTFKHINVGDATLRTDYFAAGQAIDGLINWAIAGGGADTITASYPIPLNTLNDGQCCFVRAGAANATTTPTFSPDGITARTIVKNGGSALVAGDIAGDGHELILRYLLASTRWELLNPASAPASAALSDLATKWTPSSASGSASLQFFEDTDNGSNKATVTAPASLAADATITLPGATGTLATLAGSEALTNKSVNSVTLSAAGTTGQFLNGTGALADNIVQGTPQASTSGTSIDFDSLPAGVKRITINFVGVSTSGTSNLMVQIGDAGGIEATGYLGAACLNTDSSSTVTTFTTGYGLTGAHGATVVLHGQAVLCLADSSTFTWTASVNLGTSSADQSNTGGGSKSLSAVLDRVRITTVGGSDTFDAGKINIMYEL